MAKIPILEDLIKKAIDILAKYEIIEEKVKGLGENIKDHERRIIKLEGAYDLVVVKVQNAVLQEIVKFKQIAEK